MSLPQNKVKRSLPQNKVTRSCIEGETSDMVFLETHVTDEVVPENFMDPEKQNNFHLGKSKNLEEETQNFQDRHKVVIPVEEKPPLLKIHSSVLQRKNCKFSNVHSRTVIYLQPLKKVPDRFSVHLQKPVFQGKNCLKNLFKDKPPETGL